MNYYLSTLKTILKGRLPGQVVIQTTDKCNATCPQCGMNINNKFKRATLDRDYIIKSIDHAAELNFQSISFTGGEPFLIINDIIDYINYAADKGIKFTRTGTNGFMFRDHSNKNFEKKIHRLARKLADSKIYTFWISMDSSSPKTHEEMRGLKGVVKGIEKALPIFRNYGIFPTANLGINRNTGGRDRKNYFKKDVFQMKEFYGSFRKKFSCFYERVIDMGFTITNTCYPMSFENESDGSAYTATSTADIVNFSKKEKTALFCALADTIPDYRSQIRIFTPRSSLYSILCGLNGEREKFPCHGGIDYFFVNSQKGETFPCGFRGKENLGRFHDLRLTKEKPHCFDCDWECFRDPSTLIAPFQSLRNYLKIRKDREHHRIWSEDIKYYRKCGFFNCRKEIDYEKLSSLKHVDSEFTFGGKFLQDSPRNEQTNFHPLR